MFHRQSLGPLRLEEETINQGTRRGDKGMFSGRQKRLLVSERFMKTTKISMKTMKIFACETISFTFLVFHQTPQPGDAKLGGGSTDEASRARLFPLVHCTAALPGRHSTRPPLSSGVHSTSLRLTVALFFQLASLANVSGGGRVEPPTSPISDKS